MKMMRSASMGGKKKRSILHKPLPKRREAEIKTPSLMNCFLGEVQSTKRSASQTTLLGNNCFCLKANCSGVVHVLEMDRALTSPCFDFPIYSLETRRLVKCNKCFYVSSLQAHRLNSRGSFGKLPLVKLTRAPGGSIAKGTVRFEGDSTQAVRPEIGFVDKRQQHEMENDSCTGTTASRSEQSLPQDESQVNKAAAAIKKPPFGEKHVTITDSPRVVPEMSDHTTENDEEEEGYKPFNPNELIAEYREDNMGPSQQRSNAFRQNELNRTNPNSDEWWNKQVTPRHHNRGKTNRDHQSSSRQSSQQGSKASEASCQHNEASREQRTNPTQRHDDGEGSREYPPSHQSSEASPRNYDKTRGTSPPPPYGHRQGSREHPPNHQRNQGSREHPPSHQNSHGSRAMGTNGNHVDEELVSTLFCKVQNVSQEHGTSFSRQSQEHHHSRVSSDHPSSHKRRQGSQAEQHNEKTKMKDDLGEQTELVAHLRSLVDRVEEDGAIKGYLTRMIQEVQVQGGLDVGLKDEAERQGDRVPATRDQKEGNRVEPPQWLFVKSKEDEESTDISALQSVEKKVLADPPRSAIPVAQTKTVQRGSVPPKLPLSHASSQSLDSYDKEHSRMIASQRVPTSINAVSFDLIRYIAQTKTSETKRRDPPQNLASDEPQAGHVRVPQYPESKARDARVPTTGTGIQWQPWKSSGTLRVPSKYTEQSDIPSFQMQQRSLERPDRSDRPERRSKPNLLLPQVLASLPDRPKCHDSPERHPKSSFQKQRKSPGALHERRDSPEQNQWHSLTPPDSPERREKTASQRYDAPSFLLRQQSPEPLVKSNLFLLQEEPSILADPPMNDPPIRNTAKGQEPGGTKAKYKDPRGRRKTCPSRSSKLTNPNRKTKTKRGEKSPARVEPFAMRDDEDFQQAASLARASIRRNEWVGQGGDAPIHDFRVPELPKTPPYDGTQLLRGEPTPAHRLHLTQSRSESPGMGRVDYDPYQENYPRSPEIAYNRTRMQVVKASANRRKASKKSGHRSRGRVDLPLNVPAGIAMRPHPTPMLSLPAVEGDQAMARLTLPSLEQTDKTVDEVIKETVTVMKSSIPRSATEIVPVMPDYGKPKKPKLRVRKAENRVKEVPLVTGRQETMPYTYFQDITIPRLDGRHTDNE